MTPMADQAGLAGARNNKPLRVRDLRRGDNGNGVFLLCRKCREECSADWNDYFFARPDTIIKHCGRPMVRVRRLTSIVAA